MLLLALLALSWLSWRYVEVPFRKRHWLASRRPLFAAGGGAMLAMLVCGVLAAKTDGLPGRLPPQLLATLAAADDLRDTARDCVTAPAGTSIAGAQLCVLGGAAEVPVTFFVWGDSHAEALLPAIEAAAVQADAPRRGLYVVRGGCVPLVGVDQVRQGYTDCSVTTESTLRFLEQRPDIGQVVLVSRWALYAMGVRYRSERGSTVFIRDAQTQSTSLTENQRVFVRGLQRTVDRLRAAGKQVLLVTQVPETEWPVPLTLARADWIGRQVDLRPRIDDYRARQQVVTTQFEALQRAGSVRLVQPHTALCDAQYCAVRSDGQPRYADTNHLTRRSASALRGLFEDGLVAGNAAPPKARQPLRR